MQTGKAKSEAVPASISFEYVTINMAVKKIFAREPISSLNFVVTGRRGTSLSIPIWVKWKRPMKHQLLKYFSGMGRLSKGIFEHYQLGGYQL